MSADLTVPPPRLTDEQITATTRAVLRDSFPHSRRLWDLLTYTSGPYEVTKPTTQLCDLAQAIAAARDAIWSERVASLQARLEAAERDAARLDWLEQQANEPGGLLLHAESDTGRRGLGLRPGPTVRTLRAAIDAATQEKPAAPSEGSQG